MEENNQSVWTFDWAELQLLFEIKSAFVNCMTAWDLENAYWKIRTLRAELDAKLSRGKTSKIEQEFEEEHEQTKKKLSEKVECDALLNEVDKARNKFNKSSQDDQDKSNFYFVLENFYLHLCRLMKVHGLYFKEGGANRPAVLRR